MPLPGIEPGWLSCPGPSLSTIKLSYPGPYIPRHAAINTIVCIPTAAVTVFPYLRQIASRLVTRLHWLHASHKSQNLEFLLFAALHIATGDSAVSTVLSLCSVAVPLDSAGIFHARITEAKI